MKYIAHRGNINGPSELENHPKHILAALMAGYDVEVDVWLVDGEWMLGHDEPTYQTNKMFLRLKGLWCHAKNFEALDGLRSIGVENFFWHQKDDFTLTSSGYVWTYPGQPVNFRSIIVMPELCRDKFEIDKSIYTYGICSDYVEHLSKTNSLPPQ